MDEHTEWAAAHRAKQRAYDKIYRDRMTPEQRAKKRENGRKWYQKHRDRLMLERHTKKREYLRQWREKNRDRRLADLKEWKLRAQVRHPLQWLVSKLQHQAKLKGLEFDLTPADLELPTHCPVLGIPIVFPGPRHSPYLPSFDRIDPRRGYVKGNVLIISWRANCLKRDCTDPAELRAVADYMEKHMAASGSRDEG
jgi:hypothetical protein